MYQYKAKVLRWIDGDSVLVRIDLGFHCERQERIRLARINAHELRGNTPYKRRMARTARFQAKKICPEGSVVIVDTKRNPRQDMYARYIAEIKIGKKNVSDELLKRKVVRRFIG
jgi:micrococcal nuclease